MELETQPKMVGREDELTELKTYLERARQGHGNTVFIAGEAGVGKTRLLEELKGYAKEQGVDVLQGWSLYESLTPYMPFLDALRSGGLESLFADEAKKNMNNAFEIFTNMKHERNIKKIEEEIHNL